MTSEAERLTGDLAVPGGSLAAVEVAAAVPLGPGVHLSGVSPVWDAHVGCLAVGHSGGSPGRPGQHLEGVRGSVQTGGEGDGAEVQLLSEADLVRLAGENLTVGEVEALDVAEYPRVVLEAVGRGSPGV